MALLGVLLDLPTVCETFRACEGGAHHIKVADVAQVLECVYVDGFGLSTPVDAVPEAVAIIQGYADQQYALDSGLTPPMAHCVSRRFARSTIPSLASFNPGGEPPADSLPSCVPPATRGSLAEIDATVREMLSRDAMAMSSVFELVDASTGSPLYIGGDGERRFMRRVGEGVSGEDDEEDDETLLDESVAETSTVASGGDSDAESDFAAELEEELLATQSPGASASITAANTASSDVQTPPSQPTSQPAPISLASVPATEDDVRAKIAVRRAQLAGVSNPLIRARLEDAIRQMEADLTARRP